MDADKWQAPSQPFDQTTIDGLDEEDRARRRRPLRDHLYQLDRRTFLLDPVLNNPDYIISGGSDTQVLLGALLDLVNAFACIGTAVALFSVVKRQHEGSALAFVTSRVVEAVILVVAVLSVLAVVTLRQPGAAGAEAATLVTVQRALLAIRGWIVLLGVPVIAGINALLLGSLMYRSRLVPRVIPALGLIGAPLMISSAIGTMFSINEMLSVWSNWGRPDLRVGAVARALDGDQGLQPVRAADGLDGDRGGCSMIGARSGGDSTRGRWPARTLAPVAVTAAITGRKGNTA